MDHEINKMSNLTQKRIAFVSVMGAAPWGGSEFLWAQAAAYLAKAGHSVFASVVGWPNTAPQLIELESLGVVVIQRYPEKHTRFTRFQKKVAKVFRIERDNHPGWDSLRSFSPDLVCISQGAAYCGTDWMLRCHKNRLPYVSICQSNSANFWPSDRMLDDYREAYLNSVAAFFVADANLVLARKQLANDLPNAEVVKNPFNVSWDCKPIWPGDEDVLNLACVARLEPGSKGQDILFDVMTKPKWRARPVRVTLFGSGDCERGLRELVRFMKLEEAVRFGGYKSVIDIWNGHHALVLPSRGEGLPLAIVEAMLCARASIVTDVDGNAELLKDNETGFVAEGTDDSSLDEALERAWNRRAELRSIGQAAAKAIRQLVPKDPAEVFARKLLECSH
jgi:glycosyltransferase involved in cell wall biosynthesis